mmetsp:Transcript_111871/g.198147  ORF Transcript_111871/g.198147 Transcript_111871/m.198147 type:complete len:205 (+) Transcript_111871:55-669(+)
MLRTKLPGLLFLRLVSIGACANEKSSCEAPEVRPAGLWADDLDVEQRGLQLLQAKGTKVDIDQAQPEKPVLVEEPLQASEQASLEARASGRASGHAAQTTSKSKCHIRVTDTACGWGSEDSCQSKNEAYVNDGAMTKEGVEREAALRICGPICNNAGSACGGFSWKEGTCSYYKSSSCGVTPQVGTDCYQKGHEEDPIPGQELP